jgi:tetratricopeptide (TPR) repeat protein
MKGDIASNKPVAARRQISWRCMAAGAGLVLLVLVSYLPVWRAGFIWDDDLGISGNPTLRTLDGLEQIWTDVPINQFYPVTHTSFWIEYHLWGLHPLGYHVDNVVLHALSAVLVWRLLRRLAIVPTAAWLAAAIWAVHPLNVESVAWVSERKNVLSGALYLLAMTVWLAGYFPAVGSEPSAALSPKRSYPTRRRSFATGALYIAALLAKTTAASMPAAALVILWWKRGRLTRRDVFPMIPLLTIGAAMGSFTASLERNRVGASGPEWAFTFSQRLLIAGRAAWFYLGKLVWPRDVAFSYGRWDVDATQAWQWLFPIAAVVAVIALWMLRRRIGRAPVAVALLYGGMIFPALGFSNVYPMRYSFVANHFAYLALLAPIALVVDVAIRWGQRHQSAMRYASALVVVGLSVLTFRLAAAFRTDHLLWQDTLAKSPDSWIAHASVGAELVGDHQFDQAIQHYQRALELYPHQPDVYTMWGHLLEAQAQPDAAAAKYRQAVEIDPSAITPRYALAQLLYKRGDLPDALDLYGTILDLNPRLETIRLELAHHLVEFRQYPQAEAQYQQALEINPHTVAGRIDFAEYLYKTGRLPQALELMGHARRIAPPSAKLSNNYGVMLRDAGQLADAAAEFQSAVDLDPKFPEAKLNLATTLEALGRPAEAAEQYRAALSLRPGWDVAQKGLVRTTGSSSK